MLTSASNLETFILKCMEYLKRPSIEISFGGESIEGPISKRMQRSFNCLWIEVIIDSNKITNIDIKKIKVDEMKILFTRK